MKTAVVLSTNEAETAWNAFRFANFALSSGDDTTVFLINSGVDYEKNSVEKFNSVAEAEKFAAGGGKILACGTCMKARNKTSAPLCPISSMKELYELVKNSDKMLCF